MARFEELRLLKAQITQELQRKDRLDNIKLGPGGIREIEFIGQAFQLIRGGKEKRLQHRSILTILSNLGELNLLSATDVKQLTEAYGFLRRAENHIQQYQDKQTHDLPNTDATRHVLALSMGYEDWQAFSSTLEHIRRHVHSIFADVFSLTPESSSDETSVRLEAIGEGELGEKLQALGFAHAEASLGLLNAFKQSPKIKRFKH
ncbi:hypothetical protein [Methylocucumis oryzae]|uniref:[protein-PII] uridylyltransferase family protein n=1 Tax=Methylocucumis oryzae TaxID=1632867 RepID=UPI000AF36C4A